MSAIWTDAIRSGGGDVLIAISFAPYSEETLELAEYTSAQGCQVIAVTDAINSPLGRFDNPTPMVSEIDVGAFRALSATVSLATALSVAVGARRGAAPVLE